MSIAALPALGLSALDALATAGTKKPSLNEQNLAKAKSSAQDFEAVFLNSMFQQMSTSVGGEGPFGGDGASGVWRSFLTDEYSKTFAKAGGIGIADHVYSALIAKQSEQGSKP
jgi:Rod binding domain-containing protein